jgi:glycosyltransferase involved in cell wall biosynthesis
MTAELSVTVPFCRRPEISRTLGALAADPGRPALDVIVVECGPTDAGTAARVLACAELAPRWIDARRTEFNKSYAVNIGVHHAAAGTVLLLDADVLVAPGFLGPALRLVRPGVMCALGAVEETRYPGRFRPAPGILMCSVADYRAVGGMNSELSGWGFDDLDLIMRLRIRGVALRPVGRGVHLTHGDDKRDLPPGTTTAESDARNRARAYRRMAQGRLTGTYRSDVARWHGS